MKAVKEVSKKINDKFVEKYGINNFNKDAKLFIRLLKKGLLCFSSQSKGKSYLNEVSVKALIKCSDGVFRPADFSYFCSLFGNNKLNSRNDKILVRSGGSKVAIMYLYYDIIRGLQEEGFLTIEEYEKLHWGNPNII